MEVRGEMDGTNATTSTSAAQGNGNGNGNDTSSSAASTLSSSSSSKSLVDGNTNDAPTESESSTPPAEQQQQQQNSSSEDAATSANSTIASETSSVSADTSDPPSASPAAVTSSLGAGSDLNPTAAEDPQTILSTIGSITSRLLSLRVSPPGTTASLSESEIKDICKWPRPIFLDQPMLLELEAPLKICGDVHGQFTDLLRLFAYGGFPPNSNYLFLGDYVDRGKQSLETICLLLCYKIQYAKSFFILRGNHESAGINRIYGFYDECKRRYSIRLWKVFSDVFNFLPAIVHAWWSIARIEFVSAGQECVEAV
jgi:hypothetical protein